MPGDEQDAAGLVIAVDDPQAEDVRQLVEHHLAFARAEYRPSTCTPSTLLALWIRR